MKNVAFWVFLAVCGVFIGNTLYNQVYLRGVRAGVAIMLTHTRCELDKKT